MAGSTSKIAIEVVANALGMDKGLRTAEMRLSRFESVAKNASSVVGNAFAGIAAGLTAGAFVSSIDTAIKRLDDIGDLASGLGDSAESLSKIQYAVERLGGSGDAVTSILSKMSKSIGSAALEGGPAADAIKAIGLNVEDLAQMAPSEAFIEIVDAIGRIPSVYTRAALGADIFGKGVTEISAVLKAGEGEMAMYMDRADRLGITISEGMAEKGGAAKDAIGDLRGVMGAIANTIAVELSPEIVKVVDNIGDLNKSMKMTGELTRDVIGVMYRASSVISGVTKVIASAAPALYYMGTASLGTPSPFEESTAAFAASLRDEGIANIASAFKDTERSIQGVDSAAKDAGRGYEIAAEQIEGGNDKIVESSEKAAGAVEKVQKATEALVESTESRQSAANQRAVMGGSTPFDQFLAGLLAPVLDGTVYSDATAEVMDQWADFGSDLERDVMTPLEKYQEQIENISDAYDMGVISVETYQRATEKAFREMQSAVDAGSADLGYTNLGMSGPIGGDMPGMSDPAYDRFMQYNTLPGGFVGGSIPDNQRTFTPPEWGSRQVDFRSNYSESNSGYGMDENNRLLKAIADGVQNAGMVA